MPRTANKGRRKEPAADPLTLYQRLEHHKQVVCWNYFQYTHTEGEEGWNPVEAGSVFQYRSSAYIQSLGSASWFRHLGKQMVTLAEKFAQAQQVPTRPVTATTGARFPSLPLPPDLSSARRLPDRPFATPPPLPKTMKTPRTPQTPARNNTAIELNSNNSEIVDSDGSYPSLPFPVTYGFYTQFDYTARKKVGRVLVRILTHSAVELQDIEYEWTTPRLLKLRIAWPEWFQYAEQMALFVMDGHGAPLYPPEHPVTEDMASNNMLLQDELTKRVWDEGYVKFDRDMKEENFSIERLNVKISSKNIVVRGIQFCAE